MAGVIQQSRKQMIGKVGEHAVVPHHRQKRRQKRERCHEPNCEALASQRMEHNFLHAVDIDGQVRVQRGDLMTNRTGQRPAAF